MDQAVLHASSEDLAYAGTAAGVQRSEASTASPILIVEDEAGLAEVLSLHLEAAGYETLLCQDGLAAIYETERQTPSLVLLDLHVPQISGFRLIQLLKQRPETARVPVIVITALSFPEAEDAVRAGADDFIQKPFMPDEVVTRVRQLLARVS